MTFQRIPVCLPARFRPCLFLTILFSLLPRKRCLPSARSRPCLSPTILFCSLPGESCLLSVSDNKAVFSQTRVSHLGSYLVPDITIWPQHEEAAAAAAAETRRAAEANERALVELSDLLSQLSARLQLAVPPASSVPASAPLILQQGPEPRVGEPERYEGNPESCDALVVNCSLLFSLQPRTFTTEAAKVAYTITHLTGRAWLWGTAEWERQSEACSTFSAFASELQKVFGQRNSRSSAGR
ncbi:hypothetical protein D4764_0266300 [Takifugu flavidus]|uniref:DUF4939 domain-containing protein n=1 Tax=Takifugu flavidus TaxID=433684 RepID=A0A5C6MH03_9TELE|nr:hypothetical protein D4764_0266300 [Takifugu flavidus]